MTWSRYLTLFTVEEDKCFRRAFAVEFVRAYRRTNVLWTDGVGTQDEATFDGNFRRTLTPIYATLACIRAGGGLQHCHAHKINIVML